MLLLLAVAALRGPRHAQILEHLLQLRQHLPRLVLGAGAGEVAGAIQHLLQVAHRQHVARIGRLELARIHVLHLLRELLHVAVHRLLQLVHQPLDLVIRRVARERVLQLLHRVAQIFHRGGAAAFLDPDRRVPQQLLHRRDRAAVAVEMEPRLRRAHPHEGDDIVVVAIRPQRQIGDGLGDRVLVEAFARQLLALLDQRLGDRVTELALGKDRLHRLAGPDLAERILGLQLDAHRHAGPEIGGEVEEADAFGIGQMLAGEL